MTRKNLFVLVVVVILCTTFFSATFSASERENTVNENFGVGSQNDLSGYTIAVDPGHGGNDPGAIGPNGYSEAECCLDIGLRLRDLLESYNADVVMTRESDVTVGLHERANIANNAGADIFVSIHNNAFDGTAQGIETYYFEWLSPWSEAAQLADSVQSNLIDEIDSPDRGVKTASFTVLSQTNMPAILTENMFIDNPHEEAKLMQASVRQRIAEAHLDGIAEYFGVDLVDPEPEPEPTYVDITSPSDGASVDGVTRITADAQGEGGISWARMRVSEGVWYWDSNAPHEWYFDMSSLNVGDHSIEVEASDNAGNRMTDSITVSIDPSLEITEPGEWEGVSGVTYISADIQGEGGISWARMRVSEGVWYWDSNAPHEWYFDMSDLPSGWHPIEVQAQDNAGNFLSDTIHVYVF